MSALQQILNQQGYLATSPTGYFGSQTALALKKFQTAHGIEALGGVGPKTRAMLNTFGTAPTDKAALIASLMSQVKALEGQIAALLPHKMRPQLPQALPLPSLTTHQVEAVVVAVHLADQAEVAVHQPRLPTRALCCWHHR